MFIALASCTLALCNPSPEVRDDRRLRAEALLARARQLSDIRSQGVPAFQLKAHIRILNVPGGVPEGKYEEFRNSRGLWRRALHFSDIKHTAVEAGDGQRMGRYASSRYAPYFVFRIEQMLRPSGELRVRRGEMIVNLHRRRIEKRRADCVELKSLREKRRICMDAESGSLVLLEERSGGHKWVFEFARHAPLGDKRFPGLVREKEHGKAFIEVEVRELARVAEPPEEFFRLPEVPEKWPICEDPEPPEAVEHPPPQVPRFGRRRRAMSGSVLTYIVVGVDGRAYNATPIRSDARLLASKTLDTVSRRWRFKPAACGGQPIPAPFFIATAFYAF